jgi:RNA polymerase sigma-70 factor, ECF subfamily
VQPEPPHPAHSDVNVSRAPITCDFSSVYADFHEPLRRFVAARVAEPAVDDVLQEIYLRIHAHLRDVRDCSRLPAWIYQIARRAVVDHYRSRRLVAELAEGLPAPEDPCADEVECEVVSWLNGMIGSLPPRYANALALAVGEGLSQQEIADRLGLSLSGAKSRVQRGRDKLKEMLLQCCHFEYDRYGGILDYQPLCCCCAIEADER